MGGVIAFVAQNSWAAVQSTLGSGAGVAWRGGAQINFAGNPTNRAGITPSQFFQSVVRSLNRWKSGSQGKVGFDYWQGTRAGVYETNSNLNGQSSIYFTSVTGEALGRSVIGRTQVWFNDRTGDVYETDIALNDRDFVLTVNSADSTVFGANRVFIENILTHEIGHAYGLSHDQSPLSTMLFVETPGQSRLGCDDMAAVRGMYSAIESQGRIKGVVRFGSATARPGSAAFGARVLAISRDHGRLAASAIAQADGSFTIGGLDSGSYSILIEPFYVAAQVLPTSYSTVNPYVCPAQRSFARTALATGSDMDAISVVSGQTAWVEDLEANCSATGSAATAMASGAPSMATAPEMNQSSDGSYGLVDQITSSYGSPRYYKVSAISGEVHFSVLAQAVFSKLNLSMRLLNASGAVGVSGQSAEYGAARIDATALPAGDYFLEVTPTLANITGYSGSVQSSFDSGTFFVVSGVQGRAASSRFPAGAVCAQDESGFTSYQSPAGDPPRSTAGQFSDESGFGACGRIQRVGEESPADTWFHALVGMGPWILMLAGLWFRRIYATI